MEINIGNITISIEDTALLLCAIAIIVMSVCLTVLHCQDTWSQERLQLVDKGMIPKEYMEIPKEYILQKEFSLVAKERKE